MSTSVIDMSQAKERRDVAVASEATSLLQIIERAARDPSVDLDRMERLMQMHRQLVKDRAKVAYAEALARVQPKLPMLAERGSIKNNSGAVQSKYALWEDIITAITPILAGDGFSLSFRISHPEKQIAVTGVLTHAEGHSEETTIQLPADTSGSKNAVQAVASSVSYGKRYTAGALLNLRSGEPDRDGQGGSDEPTLTEEEIANLEALLTEVGGNKGSFLRACKVDSLAEIPRKHYSACVQTIEARRKK